MAHQRLSYRFPASWRCRIRLALIAALAGFSLACEWESGIDMKLKGTGEHIGGPRNSLFFQVPVPERKGEVTALIRVGEEVFELRFWPHDEEQIRVGTVYADPLCKPEPSDRKPLYNRLGGLVALDGEFHHFCRDGAFFFSEISYDPSGMAINYAVQFRYRDTVYGDIEGNVRRRAFEPNPTAEEVRAAFDKDGTRLGSMMLVRFDNSPSAWSRRPASSASSLASAKPGYVWNGRPWQGDASTQVSSFQTGAPEDFEEAGIVMDSPAEDLRPLDVEVPVFERDGVYDPGSVVAGAWQPDEPGPPEAEAPKSEPTEPNVPRETSASREVRKIQRRTPVRPTWFSERARAYAERSAEVAPVPYVPPRPAAERGQPMAIDGSSVPQAQFAPVGSTAPQIGSNHDQGLIERVFDAFGAVGEWFTKLADLLRAFLSSFTNFGSPQ